jgi:predicted nucleotidyltransferase
MTTPCYSTALDDATVERIVQCVRNAVVPHRIILFGSAVTGPWTSDSDIDLLILLNQPQDRVKESEKIREALSDLGIPVDVVVMSRERFDETKNVIGGMAFPANKYGRVIYESGFDGCG